MVLSLHAPSQMIAPGAASVVAAAQLSGCQGRGDTRAMLEFLFATLTTWLWASITLS